MQSRKMSLIETVANIGIGFLISLLTARVVFPQYQCSAVFQITLIFTMVSIVRSYAIRRFFNWCNTWQTNSGLRQELSNENLKGKDMSKE